jgi:hypothetical protein
MDRNAPAIQPDDLYARFGTANAPLLIDVRRRHGLIIYDALYKWWRLQAEKQRPIRGLASEKSA